MAVSKVPEVQSTASPVAVQMKTVLVEVPMECVRALMWRVSYGGPHARKRIWQWVTMATYILTLLRAMTVAVATLAPQAQVRTGTVLVE